MVAVCIGVVFFIEPVKAQWGCDTGCTGAQVCAEFPNSSDVNFDATSNSYSGCHASPPFPSVGVSLHGDSYCTDNILDGMSSSTSCSTPVIWGENNSVWFHWLTGETEINNNSACLMPGDFKSRAQFYSQCATTSTPNDPISTLPPSVITNYGLFFTDNDEFTLRDFHLESSVKCDFMASSYDANEVAQDLSPIPWSDGMSPYEDTWTFTHTGAEKMAVHFDLIEVGGAGGTAFLEIYDGEDNKIAQYYDDSSDLQTIDVRGDTIKVKFITRGDYIYNYFSGWHIDKYIYYTPASGSTLVSAPVVNLYADMAYKTNNEDDYNNDYVRLFKQDTMPAGLYIFSEMNNLWAGTPSSYLDYNVNNNSTYYYYIDAYPYYFSIRNSEVIAVPIDCPDLNASTQLATGFNMTAEKTADTTVKLKWEAVDNAVQYFVTKNNRAIYSNNSWTNYYYNGNATRSTTTTYLDYLTTNNYTDTNATFADGDDTNVYRVYAVLPDDFFAGDEFEDWDPVYTWNSRYPWDHNLVLSEEVVVYADGSVEETDADPIDNGGGSGTATCNQTCSVDGDCTSGLSCVSNMCRNTECTTSSSCNCSFSPSETSSITDHQSNTIANQPITTVILYDIRTDETITDGSIKILFPDGYVFGTLTSTDVTVEGGNVTWGTPVIDSGNRTVVVPFTGELSRDDDRITITIGGINYLTNPIGSGTYLIGLTSHDSLDGTGPIIDQAEDNIEIQDASDAGKGTLSDTLSVSLPGNDSRHTIRYNISQTARSITNGSLKVTLDNEFDMSGITDNDITIIGGDVTWSSDKIIYGDGVQIGWWQSLFNKIAKAQGENSIVFNFTGTLDGTDEMITIIIGDDNYIGNPINTGSFSVDLTTYESTNASGNIIENLLAKVFINSGVTVTATVPSSLTFTVLPVNSAQPVNGATTNVDSASGLINFGVVEPNQTKIAAQDLQVATNAADGFAVTLQSLNNFTSTRGDSILPYTGTDTLPTLWSSPSGGTAHGYFGYTTDDYTLSNIEYDRFSSNRWAGATMTASEVMYHNGPINSIGQGQGTTRVGYQLEIDNLQPAGIYTTDLMYICTATF